MNDYLSPEYIKLAEKIQDMNPDGRYVVGQDGRVWLRDALAGTKDWEDVGRNPIRIPDLSWLVRKLAEARLVGVGNNKHGWYCHTEDRQLTDGKVTQLHELQGATAPEMACLKALCRIKGIDVD